MDGLESLRKDFPGLHIQVHGKPLVYLDNAATTQKPQPVLDAMMEYYTAYTANVHRGIYFTSAKATSRYEAVRVKVAELLNAPSENTIIFTKGTTESINLVAYSWARKNLGPDDEILITEMEHHSNLVPWQLAARDCGATLKFIPITPGGELDLTNLDTLLTTKTRLVAMTHQSNVLGTVNPVEKIIRQAHAVGALVLLDAAQSVPHRTVDIQALGCDFLAFSGHKMLGPTAVGVLYGRKSILDAMEPFLGGGEMIDRVTMRASTWNTVPHKFEAGTPNIAQVIGLGAAIAYLNSVGFDRIHSAETRLTAYARQKLKEVPGIQFYGPESGDHGSVISFNLDGIHAADVAQFLDQDGIAVRAGHHCAQPVMDVLGISATVRASLYFYNTEAELDQLAASLTGLRRYFD